MVVEAFLVVSVASFNLPIMPWCPRSNQLVDDLQSRTLDVHRVNHFAFPEMCELTSVVCLDDLREVSEIGDCPANEIHGRVAADFFVRIDEPFSGCFVDHGVLVKPLAVRPGIAG